MGILKREWQEQELLSKVRIETRTTCCISKKKNTLQTTVEIMVTKIQRY